MHLKIAIALLSAGAIAYEILLIRILSIIQWHHFAAMTISLALLGYGISGTMLTLLEGWLSAGSPRRWRATFITASVLFGVLGVACAVLVQRVPFNPLAVVWDPRELLNLASLSLLLTIPFLLAGTAVGVALMSGPDLIGSLYGADLIGAGAGAAMLLTALYLLPVSTCLQVIGALGCLAAGVFALGHRQSAGIRRLMSLAVAGLAIVILWPQSWLDLRLSEYKALHKALLVPGAAVAAERSSPMGLLTVVRSAEIPFRHAPGLSLEYRGALPDQMAVFTDGESMTVINEVEPGETGGEYLDFLPSALPYAVLEKPTVLILGAGGGSEILLALRHEASRIDAVESNPQMVELLDLATPGRTRGVLERPEVTVHIVDARSFLRRNEVLFDLIEIPLTQSLAAAAAGAQDTSASHLFTVEAFVDILQGLKLDGLMVVHQWIKIPPRQNLKLFASLTAALRVLGVQEPGRHLAQIRGWGTAATLVKRSPLSASEIHAIERFCEERSFDLTSLPGLAEHQTNAHHRLDDAYLYRGNKKILQGSDVFFAAYKFNVRPATDDRPFFFHTFKWQSLPELLRLGSRAGVPLVEWGYLILVATVMQALLVSVALILIPLRLVGRSGPGKGSTSLLIFFSCLGMGFMLLEVAFFQRFTLFLGHPTFSVAVVLAAFLVSAGLGSVFSRWLLDQRAARRVTARMVAILILALGSIYWFGLPALMGATLALPLLLRAGLTFMIVAPLGFLLGMPFPLGLAVAAARRTVWVPWAWGINGGASVVGAAAAPLIALHLGFSAVILVGLLLYAVAASTSYSGLLRLDVKDLQEE